MSFLKPLVRRVLAVPLEETTAARRGFRCGDPAVVAHLERIGVEFLAGYHAALEESSADVLAARLSATVDPAFRGFAFEGAGMACTLTDRLGVTRAGFARLLRVADGYRYLVHVGAGWAWARVPWIRDRFERARGRLDPVLGWLAVDGYGFHEGYFHPARTVREQRVPRGVSGYARRAFDQGVGRSLWFVEGADPDAIARRIQVFAHDRAADLWSGVGLGCSYAGGVSAESIRRLFQLADRHRGSVSLGCAFACEARHRANNLVPHTDAAARVLCGLSADEAAAIARDAMSAAAPHGSTPGYELWRRRTQGTLAGAMSMARPREVIA